MKLFFFREQLLLQGLADPHIVSVQQVAARAQGQYVVLKIQHRTGYRQVLPGTLPGAKPGHDRAAI